MTDVHLIAPFFRRNRKQRAQVRRRYDLTRHRIAPTVAASVSQRRLAQVPPVLARERATRVPMLARLVPDADLHVADAPRFHGDGVQRGFVGPAVRGLVVGASPGAEEEVGARGPAVGEEGFHEVVVVRPRVAEGGQGEGGVGARVVPPGAADAVFVVRVALDEVRGRQGSVADELLGARVPGQSDDDVARGQAGCYDVRFEGGGQVYGFGFQGGAGCDEGSVGGEEVEGCEVVLDESERVGDVLLVGGFDGAETIVDVADLDDFRVERACRVELLEYPGRLPQGCFRDGCNGLAELSRQGEQRCEGREGL